MVAMFEVAFLIVVVAIGVWWFRRTNWYRAYRRSPGIWAGREMRDRAGQNLFARHGWAHPKHPGSEE
jgi:hypothetical protein